MSDSNPPSDQSQNDPLAEALKKAQVEAEQKDEQEKMAANSEENHSLEKLQIELDQMKEVAQHALADLANFKRRAEEQRSNLVIFANEELIKSLLPVLDNFKRSLNHLPENPDEPTKIWIDGIMNTFKQFKSTLEQKGLQEIDSAGTNFDPHQHEALLQGPGAKNIVIEELEGGYKLGEKVLRHAKVKVGNGEGENTPENLTENPADNTPTE